MPTTSTPGNSARCSFRYATRSSLTAVFTVIGVSGSPLRASIAFVTSETGTWSSFASSCTIR